MIGSNPYKRSIIIDDVTVEVNPRNRLSLIRSDTLKRERERERESRQKWKIHVHGKGEKREGREEKN